MNRINGKSFDIRLLGIKFHVESFSISIEDNSTVAKNKGIPNGNLEGDVSASGEIVLDSNNFKLISEAAKKAGSYREIPAFDIDAYAKGASPSGEESFHVNAFECRLRLSELLSVDPNSTDKTTHKIPFDVTGPDFIWINDVPYLRKDEFSQV